MRRIDAGSDEGRATGARLASDAVARGEIIVLPTDTLYGVGADAFNAAAVIRVLAAKRRERVTLYRREKRGLVVLDGLATDLSDAARELVAAFWPGPLTLVCRAQPSLQWDLGDTGGTVALRMPLHRVALALLELTGPLAVTSANRTGQPPATTCDEAVEQLGEAVSVYLDGGPSLAALASTIIDVTSTVPRVLRVGALSLERLRAVVPDLELPAPPT